jgi:hypothetical protein
VATVKFPGTQILYRAGSAVPEVVCSSPMRVISVPHSCARHCVVNRKPTAENSMLKSCSYVFLLKCISAGYCTDFEDQGYATKRYEILSFEV